MITSINDFKLNEAMKFTFKTEKPTGKWKSFDNDSHYIKLNGKQVGAIHHAAPFKISFTVLKTEEDKKSDKNPNCPWKRITLKKESTTLQEAKDFANMMFDKITKEFTLYPID